MCFLEGSCVMCGIFGTYNLNEFRDLMELNSERGSTSIGIMRMTKKPSIQHFVEKYELETFDMGKWGEGAAQLERQFHQIGQVYYLGHIQAPTEGQDFTKEESHPFNTRNLIWAHNGIIQNHLKLRNAFLIPAKPFTDSFAIGCLIDNVALDFTVLEELDGTFACWLYDTRSGEIYLFRATNSVYFTGKDKKGFSSISPNVGDPEEVPQGRVFKLTGDGFVEHMRFNIQSQPFYIPE